MLKRKASKSTNLSVSDLDLNLGPPLRLTDIEHYTPLEDAENCFEEKENNSAASVNRSNGDCQQPLKLQQEEYVPVIYHEPSNNAITHPCNTPRQNQLSVIPTSRTSTCHHTPTSHTPTNHTSSSVSCNFASSGLIMGSRNLHKLSLLGRGGSSQVFKVLTEDGNLYALKEIYMKTSPPAIKAAYINEIKLLKKLKGKPQIITLYDYAWDKHEETLRLLLEHGEMDLGEMILTRQATNPLRNDPLLLMFLWQQMLNSVKIIHAEGIIHNDLKPENFVCSGLQLKLIDFGIANRIEEEHTSIERDIRCGTANYMAPECIMTHDDHDYFKIGRASDVWSLGCILYQMIFHHTPFEHVKGKIQKFHAITDPSFIINFPFSINIHPQNIIKQCLHRNPKQRPTIDQLLKHDFISMHTILDNN